MSIENAAAAFVTELEAEDGVKPSAKGGKASNDDGQKLPVESVFERLSEGAKDSHIQNYADDEETPKPPKEDDEDEDDQDDEDEGDEDADEDDDQDEDEDDDEDDDEKGEKLPVELDTVVQVTIDGKPQEVTLKEALEGYIRTETFHQRMNGLHAEKQVIEREKGEISTARQVYGERLKALTDQLDALTPKEPDWDKLYAEDAVNAARTERQWRTYKDQRAALEGEKTRVAQESERENATRMAQYVNAERAKMVEENPQWKDPKVWSRDKSSMERTAKAVGFTDDDLNTLYDSRMVKILHKAAKYDRMMAKKPKPFQKGVRPFVQPGAGTTRTAPKASQMAEKNLARSGSVQDASKVFENYLSREERSQRRR